jgi:death-on-curing protein
MIYTYEPTAAYIYGIVKNHPFIDGNKRLAFLCAENFLWLNGWRITSSQVDIVSFVVSVASGNANQDQVADWLAQNSEPKLLKE